MTDAPPQHRQADRATVRFTLATRADDSAIRRLLRENPMRGAISLSLEREPDYFHGVNIGAAHDHTVLAFDAGRLVCMGQCSTRLRWLNGETRRVGYLGGLRLDAAARGRVDLLLRGYRFFHELHQADPADFYFTSIAADNAPARRLLERGVRGLPRYTFLTEFTTLVIPTVKRHASALLEHDRAEAEELATFLNTAGQSTQLAAAWSAAELRALEQHGLALDHIRVLRGRGGRIIACAALWDQRGFRQTVIRDYVSPLAWARPAVNLLAAVLTRPELHLPAKNSALAHAFVSPLLVGPDSAHLLPRFLVSLSHDAAQRGLAYLTLGFPSGHSQLARMRTEFRARTYASRLYRVQWPDDPAPALAAQPCLPEVALL